MVAVIRIWRLVGCFIGCSLGVDCCRLEEKGLTKVEEYTERTFSIHLSFLCQAIIKYVEAMSCLDDVLLEKEYNARVLLVMIFGASGPTNQMLALNKHSWINLLRNLLLLFA